MAKMFPLAITVILFAVVTCDVSHLSQVQQKHSQRVEDFSPDRDHHYHGQDGKYDSSNDGTGWDIRLSVPGEPDEDYPILNSIPKTAFTCNGRAPGYYADTQTRCQVFKVCANTATEGFFSFLCPNGTLFNQEVLVCDWWMNVKCVDSEKYSDTNKGIIMKNGPAMYEDIKGMLMYPMTAPIPKNLPLMNKVLQVYNPPSEMILLMNNLNDQVISQFNLPGPFIAPVISNKDSAISGTSSLSSNHAFNHQYTSSQKIANGNIGNFFTTQNFKGLNLHNAFDENTQAIKITKQQFTYPSQYDKEYTLRVPKLPSPQPFVVHLPINVPAIDTQSDSVSRTKESNLSYHQNHRYDSESQLLSNKSLTNVHDQSQSSLQKISKGLPFIVLFLQPPLDSTTTAENFGSNIDSIKSSTAQISNIQANENTNPKAITSTNFSFFTANITSQNNHINNNNYSTGTANTFKATLEKDSENITNENLFHDQPARFTVFTADNKNNNSSKGFASNINAIQNDFNQHKESSFLFYNNTDKSMKLETTENGNGLVTLFSAHIIPSGDVNKQKVFKICIPKDILSYLVNLHNSTKRALKNDLNILENIKNTTIHIHSSQPLLKTIMEKMLKNYVSNQQVPAEQEFNRNYQTNFLNRNSKVISNDEHILQHQYQQKIDKPQFLQIPLPITKPYIGPSIESAQKSSTNLLSGEINNQQINTEVKDSVVNANENFNVNRYHANFNKNEFMKTGNYNTASNQNINNADAFKNVSFHTSQFVSTSQPIVNGFSTKQQFTSFNHEVSRNGANYPTTQSKIENENELKKNIQYLHNQHVNYDADVQNSKQSTQLFNTNNSNLNNIHQLNNYNVNNSTTHFQSQFVDTSRKQTALNLAQEFQANSVINSGYQTGRIYYAEEQKDSPKNEVHQTGQLISVQQRIPINNISPKTVNNQENSQYVSQSSVSTIPTSFDGQYVQNYAQNQGVNNLNVQESYKSQNQQSNNLQNYVRTFGNQVTSTHNRNDQLVQSNNFGQSQEIHNHESQGKVSDCNTLVNTQHLQHTHNFPQTTLTTTTTKLYSNEVKTTIQPHFTQSEIKGYASYTNNVQNPVIQSNSQINNQQQYTSNDSPAHTVEHNQHLQQFQHKPQNEIVYGEINRNHQISSNEQTQYSPDSRYQINSYEMQPETVQNKNLYVTNKGQTQNEYNRIISYMQQQPSRENTYTTIEVIPAIGYALNTQQEKQTYYSTLPNTKYMSSSETAEKLPADNYKAMTYNVNRHMHSDRNNLALYRPSTPQYRLPQPNVPKRLLAGQIITHSRSQPNTQQRPARIEDFGYTLVKPTIAFTY